MNHSRRVNISGDNFLCSRAGWKFLDSFITYHLACCNCSLLFYVVSSIFLAVYPITALGQCFNASVQTCGHLLVASICGCSLLLAIVAILAPCVFHKFSVQRLEVQQQQSFNFPAHADWCGSHPTGRATEHASFHLFSRPHLRGETTTPISISVAGPIGRPGRSKSLQTSLSLISSTPQISWDSQPACCYEE